MKLLERLKERLNGSHRPENYYNGEHPFTRPKGSDASMFIQWKGTEVCMDLACRCGELLHGDGYFAHFVKCPHCSTVYQLGTQVVIRQLPNDEEPYINPMLLEADEEA